MVTKITTADDTFVASTANETFVVDANTNLVFLDADIGIHGAGTAGGRTFRINGTVDAAKVPANAIEVDCSVTTAERIIVGSSGEVTATFNAIEASGGLIDVKISGKVEGGSTGIELSTDNATLKNSGTIVGGTSDAVRLLSGVSALENSGQIISTDSAAIFADGDSSNIVNSGTIEAPGTGNAMNVFADKFDLTNTGIVLAENGAAISLALGELSGNVSATIVNEGTIIGHGVAIGVSTILSQEFITIVNTGEIIGDINLGVADRSVVDTSNGRVVGDILTGFGNDRITLLDAVVTGTVSGGLGDDVYTISSDDIAISENADAGTDTVRATGNISVTLSANFENMTLFGKSDTQAIGNGVDNVLTGNAGNNVIDGAEGEDTIRGGKGFDELTGGADADTFIFRKGDDKDAISDFDIDVITHDVLDLSRIKGITGFGDLINNHARDVDGDVVINAGHGDRIVIEGLTVDDLRAELFLL